MPDPTMPTAASTTRFGYEPALDGVRAVAVAAVFGYHAGVPWLRGGFLGVDAFFVISGFLITTLLVREWAETGTIARGPFWVRRLRRLFPALVLLLLGVSVYAVVLAPRISLHALRLDGLATLLYVANWRFIWSHQSYFEAAAGPSPLRHTWSLAVEEQWYLVWPVTLALALAARRRWSRSRGGDRHAGTGVLAAACAALAVGSAAWMAVLTPATGDTSRAYFGTDTRAQGLLVGATVALALHRWPLRRGRVVPRVAAGLGVLGLAAGVVLFTAVDERRRWMYHGGFLLAALAWAAVVVATVEPVDGPVRWLLARRPFVALGRISYGVYLWLWPVVVVGTPARVHLRGYPLVGVQALAVLVAASLSYVLVERPIRVGRWRAREWWRPAPITGLAAAGTSLVLVVATLGGTTVPGAARGAGGAVSQVTLVPRAVADPPGLSPASVAPSPPPVVAGRTVSVSIVGDSVGFALAWYAPPIAGLSVSTRAIPGCGVIPVEVQIGDSRLLSSPVCPRWLDEWRAAARRRPDVVVVFLGGWEVFDPWVDGTRLRVGTDPWRRYVSGQLERGIAALTAGTATRVALATVPCFRYAQPVLGIPSTERNDARRTTAVDGVVRAVAARHPGRVALVDYAGFACPGGRFAERVGGVVLRPDGMHTDATSTRVAWAWLAPIVLALAHRPHV